LFCFKYKEGGDDSESHGEKNGSDASKENDEWRKTKEGQDEDESLSGYDKGTSADNQKGGFYSWKN